MPTCRASPTTASNSPSACWRTPTWRRHPASISIRSGADTSFASATRARRRRWTKRWSGSRPGSNREGAREGDHERASRFTLRVVRGAGHRQLPRSAFLRFPAVAVGYHLIIRNADITASFAFLLFPDVSGRITRRLLTGRLPAGGCLPDGGEEANRSLRQRGPRRARQRADGLLGCSLALVWAHGHRARGQELGSAISQPAAITALHYQQRVGA